MRNISDVFFEFVATCCYFNKKIYTALTLFFHMCKRYFLNKVFALSKVSYFLTVYELLIQVKISDKETASRSSLSWYFSC